MRLVFVNRAETLITGTTASGPKIGTSNERHQQTRPVTGDAAQNRGREGDGADQSGLSESHVAMGLTE
jgi:hypothetical protein